MLESTKQPSGKEVLLWVSGYGAGIFDYNQNKQVDCIYCVIFVFWRNNVMAQLPIHFQQEEYEIWDFWALLLSLLTVKSEYRVTAR